MNGQKYLHIHPNRGLSGMTRLRQDAARRSHAFRRGELLKWRVEPAVIALIDEFGAEFVADPPCQPALAGVIGREYDGEVRRNFEILRHHLYAAIRDVRNCTVPWQ
jgi:hypothetical protein